MEAGSQEFVISTLSKAYGHRVEQEPTEEKAEANKFLTIAHVSISVKRFERCGMNLGGDFVHYE